MKPLTLLLPLALLTPAASAQDLNGLWRVDGKLPDGTGLRAVAALSIDADGRYRMVIRGRLADKRTVSWRALGQLEASVLTVRHVGPSGLARRIADDPKPPPVRATYKVDADGNTFAGRYQLEGTAQGGPLRYRKDATPTVELEPARLELRVGDAVELRLTCQPRWALQLLSLVEGETPLALKTASGARVTSLEPKEAGERTLRVFLGPPGGRHLREVPLVVRPHVVDEVLERINRVRVKEEKTPIVVFGLDDTLFDTRHRTRDILQRVGQEANDPRLTNLSVATVRHRIQDTLAAAGLSPEEIAGELGQKAIATWREKFVEPGFYALDRPLKGARRAATAFADAGARIVYVTDRARRGVGAIRKVLNDVGFPDGAIHCKPSAEQPGPFRLSVARELGEVHGVVAACFEHDAVDLNAYRQACPNALVVRVKSQREDPEAPALADGIEIMQRFK